MFVSMYFKWYFDVQLRTQKFISWGPNPAIKGYQKLICKINVSETGETDLSLIIFN